MFLAIEFLPKSENLFGVKKLFKMFSKHLKKQLRTLGMGKQSSKVNLTPIWKWTFSTLSKQ